VKFACDQCGRSYSVADELRGRTFKMKCKACGHLVVVKAAGAPGSHETASPSREERPQVAPPISAPAPGGAARSPAADGLGSAVSIPAGTVAGLPVGMQVLAAHHRDALLLDVALAVERARPWPLVAPDVSTLAG